MQHETINRADAVEAWMVAYMADLFDMPQDEVDVTQPFEEYGLDSAAVVAFTSDLGRWLGMTLDLRLMVDHATIAAVARHLRELRGEAAPA